MRALGRVLVLHHMSTQQTAGLGWLRERIGGIDLPGESLVQRSHDVGSVHSRQLTACQSNRRSRLTGLFLSFLPPLLSAFFFLLFAVNLLVFCAHGGDAMAGCQIHLRDGARKDKVKIFNKNLTA